MKLRIFERFDLLLLIPVLILITVGVFFIYSSRIDSTGVLVSDEYIKQIIFAATGLLLMIAFSLFDYRRFEKVSKYFFYALLAILVYTLIFGKKVNGARSWIGFGSVGVQPSELGKIPYILFFAYMLEKTEQMSELKRFALLCVVLAGPAGLILIQPDLGTASVYIPIFIAMCFVAGIPVRYLILCIATAMLTIIFTVLPSVEEKILKHTISILAVLRQNNLRLIVIVAVSVICLLSIIGNIFFKKKYFYWIAFVSGIISMALILSIPATKVLKDYQKDRLIIFLDPDIDPLGAGWNIIQSKRAIGSGSLFGQGFLQGKLSHLRYLPQQSTDFIFSIISEEWGFLGGFVVFAMYIIIMFRIVFIIKNTTNVYGYYIATGIMFMFFFHFIVNVGMAMGIMPITGIPLLFLSYGGSHLWTSMVAIGILMSINYRRLDFNTAF
ncbi:MAG: rod shape-determining protein RodA [Spirochaetaceae bacterium]|nr:rod shape-determining protein RodA [Spirochaetaceae bacterium]MBO4704892.1 rod shape-determining protein RodA [Spirochaetaceae bacterium]